jgi:hypothetical protein
MSHSPLTNLGRTVTSRPVSALDLVTRLWGGEYRAPDRAVYRFTGGATFNSTDLATSGIYAPDLDVGTNLADLAIADLAIAG